MPIVPKGRAKRLAFYEIHVPIWTAHFDEIGVSAELIAELAEATAAAREALSAQHQAQAAARSATLRYNTAVRDVRRVGSRVMKVIHAKAQQGGDNSAYALAGISPPAKPSPIAPPGRPYAFRIALAQTGVLTISWKCDNPKGAAGTMYKVYRRIGATGAFVFLAQVGRKKFVDETIPPGTATVTYQVQAMRTTAVGAAAQHMVNFGAGQALAA